MVTKVANTYVVVKDHPPKHSRRRSRYYVARRGTFDHQYNIIAEAKSESDAEKMAKTLQDKHAMEFVVSQW
jgi:hypothetical protein